MSETASGRLEWIRAAMDAYQGRLIRFAARITGDLDSARDVVQDTFLRLCREDSDKTRDHLAAWLFRVCRNRAIDVRRKEGPLMPLDEEIETRADRPVSDASSGIEEGEGTRRMLALLAALPASQQEVLRLRFQENLSYKEIAEVTGRSVSHVGVLIHDGLKALRLKLGVAAAPRVMEGGRSHA
jgi:RNA polymerase sigma-70 factor (ECF subfamily)